MKRLHWIDVAKGICILAVIIGHTKNDIVNKIVFSFHLTVFFILSGYTLKDNKLDREYVSNKFKRMMTPYFITCFCIMIMDIINLIVIKQNYKIYSISYILRIDLVRTFFASGVISNFGDINLGGMIGAIWFLPALFFALIISKIIIEKKEKHSERFIISTIIAIISIISAKFLWLPFSIQSSMLACPFIIFGKFVKEKEIIEKIKLKEAIGILAIFILGYMLNKTSIFFVEASMQDIVITPVIAILSSLLIMRISMIFEKSKTLRYIGENSLYFFCIHLFLLETSGYYIKNICSMLGWKQEFYITFIFHVIICFIVSAIINLFKRFFNKQKEKSKTSSNRNLTIDVLRSICIILMIIGHVSIDAGLRRFIFSFHMMAFMVLSGYLYKETDEIVLKRIWKEIKRLIIPLAVFSIIFIYINNFGIIEELKTLLLGMSLSRKILTNVKSIGPFCFVLLLFIVKMLYILVNHFVKTIEKKTGKPHNMIYIYIGIITYIGVLLGKNGYWLPWSLDIALYSLIFFHIGYLLKKYDILNKLMEKKYLYFVLSPIWVYMIYRGSMEIAVRKYEPFGLVIIGAISGVLVMYMFSNSIAKRLGKIGTKIITLIGSSTIYTLIIHTFFHGRIANFLNTLGLASQNIFNFMITLAIQIVGGIIMFSVIGGISNCIHSKIKQHEI